MPDGLELAQWLKIYPATGYVVTAKEENAVQCIEIFEGAGLKAAAIGVINDSQIIDIHDDSGKALVFDLKNDSITGI